jgi:hypothetical protein
MYFNGLILEYALKGSSNYITWKDKMEVVLEDSGLKDYIDKDVPKSDATNKSLCMEKESGKGEEDFVGGR